MFNPHSKLANYANVHSEACHLYNNAHRHLGTIPVSRPSLYVMLQVPFFGPIPSAHLDQLPGYNYQHHSSDLATSSATLTTALVAVCVPHAAAAVLVVCTSVRAVSRATSSAESPCM